MSDRTNGMGFCAWSVLFGAISVAACAGGTDVVVENEGGGGSGGAIFGPATCRDVAEAVCEYYEACDRPRSIVDPRLYFRSMEMCVQREELDCEIWSAAPGLENYAQKTADCFRKLASCPIMTPPECKDRGGTLPDGAGCMSDWQCSSRRCSGWVEACGTCLPTSREGEGCHEDYHCVEGLVCARGCEGALDECVVPVPVGASCDPGVVACEEGAYCAFMSAEARYECKVVPTLGEPCDVLGCAAPYWCHKGACTERSDEGGPCWKDDDCASGLFCLGDSFPGPSGHYCGVPTTLGAGEPCLSSRGRCAPGHMCIPGDYTVPGDYTCYAVPVEGQPCEYPTATCLWPASCFPGSMCQLPDPSSCGS